MQRHLKSYMKVISTTFLSLVFLKDENFEAALWLIWEYILKSKMYVVKYIAFSHF